MAHLRSEETNGVLVVYFSQHKILNNEVIKQIGEELTELTTRAVNDKMLLNFTGVGFMSSAMMGKILLLSKKCKADGVNLKLCSITPDVLEVFTIMRLNKVLDLQPTEEKAIAAFDKKGWFK